MYNFISMMYLGFPTELLSNKCLTTHTCSGYKSVLRIILDATITAYIYTWNYISPSVPCVWFNSLCCQRALQGKMWLFDLNAEGALPRLLSASQLGREPAFVQERTDDSADSDSCLCRAKGHLITVNTMLWYEVLAVPLKQFAAHTREEMFLYAADIKCGVSGV